MEEFNTNKEIFKKNQGKRNKVDKFIIDNRIKKYLKKNPSIKKISNDKDGGATSRTLKTFESKSKGIHTDSSFNESEDDIRQDEPSENAYYQSHICQRPPLPIESVNKSAR